MTDDLDLETRLRAHYRAMDPGPSSDGWMHRVERAIDRRANPASASRRWLMLAAATVLVALGLAGGMALFGRLGSAAGPSPSLPAGTLVASPIAASPEPTAGSLDDAAVELAGTFGADGVWAIRGDQLLTSSDAGATWRAGTAPAAPAPSGLGPRAATMYDADIGWVVTNGLGSTDFTGAATDVQTLVVSRTSDGGKTWRTTPLGGNFPGVSVSIAFVDNFRGYILVTPMRGSMARGTVFATDDGGASWHITGTSDTWGLDSPLGSQFSVSSTGVLLAGANQEAGPNVHPLAASSIDEGATWQVAQLPGLEGRPGGAQAYFAAPATSDITVNAAVVEVLPDGTSTHLLETDGREGGEVGTIYQEAATGVMDLGGGHWLVGVHNPMGVLLTMDAGQTWLPLKTTGLPDPGTSTLSAGGAIDATHAWLLVSTGNSGNGWGSLMLTADGGRTWSPAAFGVRAPAGGASAVPEPSSGASGSPQPADSPPADSPSGSPAAPSASVGHLPPASFGPLSVGQLTAGPSGTTQVTRWSGGFIALGQENIHAAAWLSHDGRVWWPVPSGTFGQPAALTSLEAVPFGTGLLVFAETTDGADTVWQSVDGASWTSMPMERVAFDASAVASDGTIVVAVRGDGVPGVLASSDGRSWGAGAAPPGSSFGPTSVVYRPDVGFIAVGGTTDRQAAAWTSSDGIHWEPATVSGWQAAGVTLSNLVAGSGGVLAVGNTGGTPGMRTLWAGTVTGSPGDERVSFALTTAAAPFGVSRDGEGVGSAIGEFNGDGTWIIGWGTPPGKTQPELWASRNGTTWTRIAIDRDLSSASVGTAYPVGDAILFSSDLSGDAGATDWLGDMAGPG